METHKKIAQYLLQSKAIILDTAKPFTWSSGWKSPIYCDNRKTLSYPEIRSYIRDSFVKTIRDLYPDVEVIAGVATGAIAHGALIADKMNLPFVYIRSQSKQHGLTNQIEGTVFPGQKVVVVEDLVSTGKSSLNSVTALREKDCIVMGMVAIFTYGFPLAEKSFKAAGCHLNTLSNYSSLLELALETKYIDDKEAEILRNWKTDPENWLK